MAESSWPKTHSSPLDEFERKLDWVINALTDMCDAPITVWIEKLWQPLGELILEWYAVDLKNVFVAYLRPPIWALESRSTRHWGRGEKGKKRTGFGKGWDKIGEYIGWDPNEVLGKGLWGGEDVRARPLPPGATWLWLFEGVIERLFFYWMVLDLGTEFLYNWMSAVEETKYCAASRDAILLAECGPYPLLGIFGWDAQGAFHPIKMRNIDFFNSFGVMATGGPGSAGGTAQVMIPDDGPEEAELEVRIRCIDGPSVGAINYTSYTLKRGVETSVGAGAPIASGDLIIFEMRAHAGITMLKAHLYYQQQFIVPK